MVWMSRDVRKTSWWPFCHLARLLACLQGEWYSTDTGLYTNAFELRWGPLFFLFRECTCFGYAVLCTDWIHTGHIIYCCLTWHDILLQLLLKVVEISTIDWPRGRRIRLNLPGDLHTKHNKTLLSPRNNRLPWSEECNTAITTTPPYHHKPPDSQKQKNKDIILKQKNIYYFTSDRLDRFMVYSCLLKICLLKNFQTSQLGGWEAYDQ